MFGFIDDAIKLGTRIVEDTIDVGIGVITLGECGDLNTHKVARLIASGYTLYQISEASGVAVDLLEKMLED